MRPRRRALVIVPHALRGNDAHDAPRHLTVDWDAEHPERRYYAQRGNDQSSTRQDAHLNSAN